MSTVGTGKSPILHIRCQEVEDHEHRGPAMQKRMRKYSWIARNMPPELVCNRLMRWPHSLSPKAFEVICDRLHQLTVVQVVASVRTGVLLRHAILSLSHFRPWCVLLPSTVGHDMPSSPTVGADADANATSTHLTMLAGSTSSEVSHSNTKKRHARQLQNQRSWFLPTLFTCKRTRSPPFLQLQIGFS
jgi:hypothetical protein